MLVCNVRQEHPTTTAAPPHRALHARLQVIIFPQDHQGHARLTVTSVHLAPAMTIRTPQQRVQIALQLGITFPLLARARAQISLGNVQPEQQITTSIRRHPAKTAA